MKPYTASVFAIRVGCSAETARKLDRRGIVKAEWTESRQRRFDDEDVQKAREYLGSVGRLRQIP
jgi:DNA-binding transcriptional MerR regulator